MKELASEAMIYPRSGELSSYDIEKLIIFLSLSKESPEREIELFFRLKNLKLSSKVMLPKKISKIKLYIKEFLYDLDFGPVDRLIRKFRKNEALKILGKKYLEKTILDLGCGRQATLGWCLSHSCKEYIGIDRDIPRLSIGNKTFIPDSVEEFIVKQPSNYAGAAVALALIEHLDEPYKFCSECYRVLEPGGSLIITTPPPVSAPILELMARLGIINGEEISEHKTYFDEFRLTKLLEDSGFDCVKTKKFLLGFNLLAVGIKNSGY